MTSIIPKRQTSLNVVSTIMLIWFASISSSAQQKLNGSGESENETATIEEVVGAPTRLFADISEVVPDEYKSHPEYGNRLDELPDSYELIHKRERNKRIYRRGENEYSTLQSFWPMHYKDEQNRWITIDTSATLNQQLKTFGIVDSDLPTKWDYANDELEQTLVRGKSIKYLQNSLRFASHISGMNPDSVGFFDRNEFTESIPSNTSSISFERTNAYDARAIDYWPGIDKSVTHRNYGQVKTNYIIKERLPELETANYLVIDEVVELPQGWSIVNMNDNNQLVVYDKAGRSDLVYINEQGENMGTLSAPTYFHNSKHNFQLREEVYEVTPLGNQQFRITFTIPTDYLLNDSTIYPVIIDPSSSSDTYNDTQVNWASESGGCQRTQNVNVGGTTVNVTNTQAYWQITARNGAWTSHQRSRFYGPNSNVYRVGGGNSGGTYTYDNNGTYANGNRVGNIGFTLRAWRTWGNYYTYACGTVCCSWCNYWWGCACTCTNYCGTNDNCGTYFQYITRLYIRVDWQYICTATAPTGISSSGGTNLCSGTTITLTPSGGTNGNGAQFQWFAGNCGSAVVSTANTYTVTPPVGTTTYRVRRRGTATGCTNLTSCASITVTVSAPPTAPTQIEGQGNGGSTTICSGSSVTLDAAGGTNGSGAIYQWYANGCGSGGSLGSGASINVSPTTTTTYYVRRRGNTNCTNTTGCISHTVYVKPNVLNPTSITGTNSLCQGESTTLTLNGGYNAFYTFNGNYNDSGPNALHLGGSGGSFVGGAWQQAIGTSRQSASTNILNTDYYTIEFDVRYTSNQDGTWRKMFGYNAGGSDRSPGIWKHCCSMGMHWRNDPGNTGFAEPAFTLNQWTHVTGVKKGSTYFLYHDGVLVATANNQANPKTPGEAVLWFGGAQVQLRNWRIYSGAVEWYASNNCSGAVIHHGYQLPVTPTTTTTYSARIVGECNSSSCLTRTVTVDAVPVANAGPNIDQCGTSAYHLTGASATGTYNAGTGLAWTIQSGSGVTLTDANTISPVVTITGGASGSVTLRLTVTGNSGCAGTNDFDDMVFSWASGPVANAGPDITQCGNATTYFTGSSASSGSTISWAFVGPSAGTLINGGTSNPTLWGFTPPSSGSGSVTLRLSATGSGLCGSSTVTDDMTFSWSETPVLNTTSPQNSCTGDAAIVIAGASATGAYGTLSWGLTSGGGTGSITSGGATTSPTFTPDPGEVSGSYQLVLQATGSGYCGAVNSAPMTLNWDNPPVANAGADISACEGTAVQLSGASITGGLSSNVDWQITGGTASSPSFTASSTSDPTAWIVTATSSGTVNLTLDVTGLGVACGTTHSYDNLTVTFDPLPIANAGTDIEVCTSGSPITMTGASGIGVSTYVWSESGGLGTWNQGASIPAAQFDPTNNSGTTTATLTVQGSGTCSAESDSDERDIIWHVPPTITSADGADITDCVNDNGSIYIVANGTDPLEYSIDNGSNYQSSPSFTGLSAGNYTVIVRDANNCTTTYTGNPVVINDIPPITATVAVGQNAICAGINGASISIAGITGGDPIYTYGLDGVASTRWDTVLADPFLVSNLNGGNYDVIIQDQFGCTSLVYPITLTEPAPILIGTPTIVDIIGCGGTGTGSISVSASGGTGTLNYYLNGSVNSPATSGSWTGLVGGSYEIMVQDANNCQTIANASINAPWTLSAGNDASICAGSNIQLEGNIIGEYPASCLLTCSSGCGLPGGYCGAQSSNTSDEWISRVQFNTINNWTGSNTYTNYNQTTTVTTGSNYTGQVRVSKCCGNPGWTECVTIYIDWNRNGSFGAGEGYNIGCNSANNPAIFNFNITVPTNASLGTTKMRVYHRYNGYPGSCGNNTYGEVEDYMLNIQGTGPCTPTLSWAHGGSSFTSTVAPTTTTTYTLTMNDGAGCVQSATVDVNVSDLDAVETVTEISCNASDDGCIEINAVNEVGPYLMKLGSTVQVYGGRMKPITINNTNGTLTNHPVKISSILFTAPMRADFGDVRFYDSNLNELSYWIESYTNSTTMDAWVKFPSLPNGNTTIYMVFGNSALSSESDGDAVFEFFDDFNFFDSGKWSQGIISATSGTDWSYYGGTLNGGNTFRTQTSTMTFTGSRITEARTYESASAPNGFTNAGFWGSTGNAYSILNHDGTNYMRINNTWDNFPQPAGGQRNQWMREYVRAHTSNSLGSRTREFNGATTSQPNGNYSLSGERIRLGARGDNWTGGGGQNFSARWDWMFVRPWVNTEPTASIGAVVLADNEFCDLTPGTYSVLVVDMGNCSETINFTLNEPTVLTIDGIAVTNTWCYQNDQGQLDITVSGGTQITPPPNYLYNWSGPAAFSSSAEDLTGLGAGIYNVTVADDNACTASSSATVLTNAPDNGAPNFTWRGTTDNDWTIYTNWDCGLPDATSPVIIPASPSGGNTPIIYPGDFGDCLNIKIQGNIADLLEIQPGGKLRVFQ